MIQVKIGDELKAKNNIMALGVLECNVKNTKFDEGLWKEISDLSDNIRASQTPDSIKDHPQILATRKMYAVCGKDPSRYRPSAEALMRRIVKGQDLYQISTLVDLVNLISLKTGYSIGGFDADKLVGTNVDAGLGHEGEPYNGIGRGPLNIAGLPVLRDAKNGFGTPTSDEERTAMSLNTTHFLMVINAYDGDALLPDILEYSERLLKQYSDAKNIEKIIVRQ